VGPSGFLFSRARLSQQDLCIDPGASGAGRARLWSWSMDNAYREYVKHL